MWSKEKGWLHAALVTFDWYRGHSQMTQAWQERSKCDGPCSSFCSLSFNATPILRLADRCAVTGPHPGVCFHAQWGRESESINPFWICFIAMIPVLINNWRDQYATGCKISWMTKLLHLKRPSPWSPRLTCRHQEVNRSLPHAESRGNKEAEPRD